MGGFADMYIERGMENAIIELVLDGSISLETGAKKLNISAHELEIKMQRYEETVSV